MKQAASAPWNGQFWLTNDRRKNEERGKEWVGHFDSGVFAALFGGNSKTRGGLNVEQSGFHRCSVGTEEGGTVGNTKAGSEN